MQDLELYVFNPENEYLTLKRGFASLTVTLEKLKASMPKPKVVAPPKPKKIKADFLMKIITIGDKGVGKRSCINNFV